MKLGELVIGDGLLVAGLPLRLHPEALADMIGIS